MLCKDLIDCLIVVTNPNLQKNKERKQDQTCQHAQVAESIKPNRLQATIDGSHQFPHPEFSQRTSDGLPASFRTAKLASIH